VTGWLAAGKSMRPVVLCPRPIIREGFYGYYSKTAHRSSGRWSARLDGPPRIRGSVSEGDHASLPMCPDWTSEGWAAGGIRTHDIQNHNRITGIRKGTEAPLPVQNSKIGSPTDTDGNGLISYNKLHHSTPISHRSIGHAVKASARILSGDRYWLMRSSSHESPNKATQHGVD
jgi:hypothetical protein